MRASSNAELAALLNHLNSSNVVLKSSSHDQVIPGYIRKHNCWEPNNSQLLKGILRRGDSFIDAGAHIGYFSILAANCVGPEGNVLAFEPEVQNFELLCENLALNGVEYVKPYRSALGERTERQWLFLSVRNHGGHQLEFAPIDSGSEPCKVYCELAGLDDFLRRNALQFTVNFIKIDVQGYETKALLGMVETLADNHDHLVVLIEYSPSLLLNFDHQERGLVAFHAFLETYSYKTYVVERCLQDEDVNLFPVTSEQLKEYVPDLLESTREQNLDACLDLLLVFSAAGHDFLKKRISDGL